MIIGFENTAKGIKRALAVTGGDSDAFKNWYKDFEKLRKQFEDSYTTYYSAKDSMEDVLVMLIEFEKFLADTREWNRDTLRLVEKTIKEMKKEQGKQFHPFLVEADYTDYRTTYESIVRQGASFKGVESDRILLQSEVENLLAIIRETKARKSPNTNHVAYMVCFNRLEEVSDIPYEDKIANMAKIYGKDFYQPIYEILVENIAKADRMLEEGIGGFGASRKEEALAIFEENSNKSPEERASRILRDIA